MEPVFEKRNGWKRIYIDLPGMGDSKSQEMIKNSDDMLDYVLNFLDKLIPDEPFVVCGQSYGGYLARGIANFRKKNLRGLLLICPMVRPNLNERCVPEHQVLWKDHSFLSSLTDEEICEFEQMAVIQGEQEWKRFHDEILLPSQRADDGFLEKIRECGYGFSFPIHNGVSFFQYPVLVITARQDATVGYLDALQLIDSYPRGTFAVLDMAGHYLQIEQPHIFEALVNDWLGRAKLVL
jgi:pimeloyl-ACP methyl ester carboxylesterase